MSTGSRTRRHSRTTTSRERRSRVSRPRVAGAGRSGRRRSRTSDTAVIPAIVDLDELPDMPSNSSCIDLTADRANDTVELVDLTSPTVLSPVVVSGRSAVSGAPPPRLNLRSHETISSGSDDSDLPDVEELPTFGLLGAKSSQSRVQDVSDHSATASTSAPDQVVSPIGRSISCPICMDNVTQIRASGGQIMSTTCGHIFCEACITQAIQTQRCCPTCRKKLHKKSVHKLFL